MKLYVGKHKVEFKEKAKLNSGEYNVNIVEFEFDEVYDSLIKKAVFSNNEHSYLVALENGSCVIPYEVLEETGDISIGAFGYIVDGDELILRYSPSPLYVHIDLGTYRKNYDNYTQPTADVVEYLMQQIQEAVDTVGQFDDRITANENNITNLENTKVDKIEGKGLSTEDYTTAEKTKLNDIESGAEVNIIEDVKVNNTSLPVNNKSVNVSVPTTLSQLSDDSTHRLVSDTEKSTWNNKVDKNVNDLTYYTLKTNTGSLIDLSINSSTYVITLDLKDIDGNIISTDTIDLPLESVVVSGAYDSTTKEIVLTLESGSEVRFSVADLVAGLQTELTSTNKLNADYIDDTNSGHKFVTATEKNIWNAKQDGLTAGSNITIENGTISATDTTYTAGDNVSITNGVISATDTTYNEATTSAAGLMSAGDKVKLNGIEAEATKTIVDSALDSSSTNPVQNKIVKGDQDRQDLSIDTMKNIINNIYNLENVLPSQDITNVSETSINGTMQNAPIRNIKLKGNSYQYTTTGKNLFDVSTLISNHTIQVNNGYEASSETWSVTDYIEVIENQNYCINQAVLSSSNAYGIVYYDNFKTYLSGASWTSLGYGSNTYQNIVFTPPTNAKYVRINLRNTTDFNNLQIEKGSTATNWEEYSGGIPSPNPDYPQNVEVVTGNNAITIENEDGTQSQNYEINLGTLELCKIGDYQDYFVKSGGNIFNNDNAPVLSLQTASPSLISSEKNIITYTPCKPNTTYVVKKRNDGSTNRFSICTTNELPALNVSTTGLITDNNASSISINTSSTANYLVIQFYRRVDETTLTEQQVLDSIQVEEILSPSDVKLNVGNWYKNKNVGKYTFTGSETVNKGGTVNNQYFNSPILENWVKPTSNSQTIPHYCSHFVATSPNDLSGNDVIGSAIRTDAFGFAFGVNSEINTAALCKEWLENNTPSVYYPLATLVLEQITDNTLISQLNTILEAKTYDEETNISTEYSSGNQPLKLDFKVFKKLS